MVTLILTLDNQIVHLIVVEGVTLQHLIDCVIKYMRKEFSRHFFQIRYCH